MKCNKIALAAALVLGLGAAGSAFADGGVITYVGNVKDSTCSVSGGPGTIGNGSSFTVNLTEADITEFPAANVGRGVRQKEYSLSFSDGNGGACNGLTNGNAVVTIGNGADKTNITTRGTLRNVKEGDQGAASGVEFRLLDQNMAPVSLVGGWSTTVQVGNPTNPLPGPQVLTLGVEYYQAVAAVNAGAVESFITYDVAYN